MVESRSSSSFMYSPDTSKPSAGTRDPLSRHTMSSNKTSEMDTFCELPSLMTSTSTSTWCISEVFCLLDICRERSSQSSRKEWITTSTIMKRIVMTPLCQSFGLFITIPKPSNSIAYTKRRKIIQSLHVFKSDLKQPRAGACVREGDETWADADEISKSWEITIRWYIRFCQ